MLVVGDERVVKVHVHTERPDKVVAYGLSLGTLSHINIENLDRQATEVTQRAVGEEAPEAADDSVDQVAALAAERLGSEPDAAVAAGKFSDGLQVVAVAAGEGLARVFASLGAAAVVQGGQGANPSAGELAEAIQQLGSNEVIVLPNNPNVRLAARQAGELCPKVHVEVVSTRNQAEGIAAMLALDGNAGLRSATRQMAAAAKRIQSFQVTVAVRDARMGTHRVRRGDYIVLGPSDRLLAADRDRTAAIVRAARKLKPGFELLTIYRGGDVDHKSAELLRDALHGELDGVEIELVEGGQPHYDFLVAAE